MSHLIGPSVTARDDGGNIASKGTYVWMVILFVVILQGCCYVFRVFSWYRIYPRGNKMSYRDEPEVVERREPSGSSGVTVANFETIKNGMTYREIVVTFGCEGNPRGSHRIGKTELKTYEWKASPPQGSYATVDFVRSRACRKYQHGLK